MGLFSKFKEIRETRAKKNYERYGETLQNKVTTKEQRLDAIESLEDGPAELTIPQLLRRFEIVVDHGIQDTREKEMVLEIILKHKEDAKPFVAGAIKKMKRVSWPIRIAEKLYSENDYADLLIESLSTEFVGFDEAVQERNIEILLALKEIRDPRIAAKASLLVKSRDESVRIAALECIEMQATDNKEARGLLLDFLSEPLTDENSRFIGLVKSIVARHQWTPNA